MEPYRVSTTEVLVVGVGGYRNHKIASAPFSAHASVSLDCVSNRILGEHQTRNSVFAHTARVLAVYT